MIAICNINVYNYLYKATVTFYTIIFEIMIEQEKIMKNAEDLVLKTPMLYDKDYLF